MRISVEGFSVTNFGGFKKHQESFGYIAQQLRSLEKPALHPKTFGEVISKDHSGYDDLIALRSVIVTLLLSEIKVIYTDAFDLIKETPSYMTHSEFDTQKERRQMLAKLKVLYEMFGLEMIGNESSGYLPLVLQSLQVTKWRNDLRVEENIQLIIVIIEDGTYVVANTLGEDNNPYAYVIRTLRKTLKLCLTPPKGVRHRA